MSRDGSGNYTLPVGNPVVSGTIIDVNWANPTMADIAQQLNNVITRDGVLGPLVPVGAVDGTQALPGVSFKLAPGTGLWREAAKAGYSYNGVAAWYRDSTGLVVPGNITVNSVNGGQLAGFRNRIINGGFDVWQRGTSGFSSYSYSADRWYTDAGTLVSRSTDVPPGFAYSAKHTGVTSEYAAYRTGIELPGTGVQGEYYDGATFTFSCLCKTSVAGKTLILYSAFTTAVGVVAGSRKVSDIAIGTTSTSWTKYTYTFTIPTGASIATAKCLEVTPYVNATNCDVYITGVQLEPGSVATPFEFRPYSVELALCQRYYQRIKHEQRVYAPAASINRFTISHPTMRVQPTWSTLTTGTLVNASTATAVAYGDSQSLLTLYSPAAGDSYITARVYESTGTEL